MQVNTGVAGKDPVYYRQLGQDDVEYYWKARRAPGQPFILVVRSRVRPDFENEYEVEDPNAPVTAYLMLARVEFATQMEKDANERRDRRRAAEDERARKQRDILEGQKRQSFGQEKRDAGENDEVKKPVDGRTRKAGKKRTTKRTKKG